MKQQTTVFSVLFLISAIHLLNDTFQSVIPAMYPLLQSSLQLSYTEIGLIGFALNITASVMQPAVGLYTDRRPLPYSLPIGMASTMLGMIGLALAPSFGWVIVSVLFVGFGSAVFHPESSRVVNLAAGERRGLAQSIFQVGGNAGQALAPLLTVLIILSPYGQTTVLLFGLLAIVAIAGLFRIAGWYKARLQAISAAKQASEAVRLQPQIARKLSFALMIVVIFVFCRSFYYTGIASFYPFYLIEEYGLSKSHVQLYSFLFLAAGALGTFLGGPISDRFSRKAVIVFSMIGALPFALVLPYATVTWAIPLSFVIGLITLCSFSVTVVYAQDLFPRQIGTMSGLTVGFAFGMGALSSLLFGKLADVYSLTFVMTVCSFLPVLGSVAWLLPADRKLREWHQAPVTESR